MENYIQRKDIRIMKDLNIKPPINNWNYLRNVKVVDDLWAKVAQL